MGVGLPGSISTVTGAMKNCNSTCLNGQYFQKDLSETLGRSVAIANDADCFALSEAVDGAGAGRVRVFGAILGTGVGGGLVQGGQLLQGPNGLCGEWGHNLLPKEVRGPAGPSRSCFCGHENCIETYLSGPGLSRTHAHLHEETLDANEIARREQQGDALARQTLGLFVEQLAFALSQIVNFLDPDVIVLGGGLSNIKRLYDPVHGVPGQWAQWITSDAVNTALQPAQHGDASGVRGAAWLPRSQPFGVVRLDGGPKREGAEDLDRGYSPGHVEPLYPLLGLRPHRRGPWNRIRTLSDVGSTHSPADGFDAKPRGQSQRLG